MPVDEGGFVAGEEPRRIRNAPEQRRKDRRAAGSRWARKEKSASLDHLIGDREQTRGDLKPERLCGLQIDRQLVFGRLLDR